MRKSCFVIIKVNSSFLSRENFLIKGSQSHHFGEQK